MNFSMTQPNPRQKYVLQSIALVTLAAVLVPVWNVLKKTHVSDVPISSVARTSDPLLSPLSDLYLFLSVSFLAILLGVACAFYLEEWLRETNWIRRLIEVQVSILSGVPSLLYGLLAVAIFLPYNNFFKTIWTSQPVTGLETTSMETTAFQGDIALFYATALTFVLLVMPRVIKTTQEALRSVPIPIREAAYALGADRWEVLMKHVVPFAFPRVLAGGCRAMSSVLATAALLIGVYVWARPIQSEQMPDIFPLFFGGALLLSIFASFLIEKYPPVST